MTYKTPQVTRTFKSRKEMERVIAEMSNLGYCVASISGACHSLGFASAFNRSKATVVFKLAELLPQA